MKAEHSSRTFQMFMLSYVKSQCGIIMRESHAYAEDDDQRLVSPLGFPAPTLEKWYAFFFFFFYMQYTTKLECTHVQITKMLSDSEFYYSTITYF